MEEFGVGHGRALGMKRPSHFIVSGGG
jgi:hypothetical protein